MSTTVDESALPSLASLTEGAAMEATASTTEDDREDPLKEAADGDMFVLLLYVEEGVRFGGVDPAPPYPDCDVVVEATLGCTLRTAPAPLCPTLTFREELGFKMTKRELLNLWTDSVPVAVYLVRRGASGGETDERLLVGRQQVQIRNAKPIKFDANESTVYTLTRKKLLGGHLKFAKIPSLKTSIVYERWVPSEEESLATQQEKQLPEERVPLAKDAAADGNVSNDPQRGKDDPATGAGAVKESLVPVLDVEKRCFVLGDIDSATCLFKLTVQIIHAKDMQEVLPPEFLPSPEPSFNFRFHIFGQTEIRTSPFQNLPCPEFPSETVDIRLAANVPDLARFLGAAEPFLVRFRGASEGPGGGDLATALIPLSGIAGVGESVLLREGDVVETDGLAYFTNQEVGQENQDRARIGYAVKLRHLGPLTEERQVGQERSVLLAGDVGGPEAKEWEARLEKGVLELEEWKLKRKQKFNQQLKELERSKDALLTAEFRQREEERESSHRVKQEELTLLGEELKAALRRVEAEEKRLDARERAVADREGKLAEQAGKASQLKDVLGAEGKRRIAKAEQERKEMAAKLASAEAEVRATKGRAAQVEREKADAEKRARLQVEMEVKELQRRLMELSKSKEAYRRAWEKAEADAGELKAEKERRKEQQLQDAAREIQELKAELQRVRRRGFGLGQASPGSGVTDGRSGQCQNHLSIFPEAHEASGLTSDDNNNGSGRISASSGCGPDDPELAARDLAAMEQRKEALLRTGDYKESDSLISYLNDEISKLKSRLAVPPTRGQNSKSSGGVSGKKRKSDE